VFTSASWLQDSESCPEHELLTEEETWDGQFPVLGHMGSLDL